MHLREGVRQGVVDALSGDIDRASALTARRLAVAGVLGFASTVGAIVLFSGNALEAGHGLHLALCAALWASALVECFALVLLRIRLRRVPLGQAAALALVGFGLAGCIGALCPDPHYLSWWGSTALGGAAAALGGPPMSALCFGFCTAALAGFGATAILALRGARLDSARLPAALLLALLWPAVILQSVGKPPRLFISWSTGLALGGWPGVAVAIALLRRVRVSHAH